MTLKPEDVKRVTKELLEEFGEDYVYPHAGGTCFYAEDGKPSCLLGHIAARLDPELFEDLKVIDTEGFVEKDGDIEHAEDLFALDLGEDLDDEGTLTERLFSAQAAQDAGKPWGVAAKKILEG